MRATDGIGSAFTGWSGIRVLVTGHTGFCGSWLTLWLREMGATVTGLSLPGPAPLFDALRLQDEIDDQRADVRDPDAVRACMQRAQPEVVFHLAAQPLVAVAQADPVATYATNIMGTAHVLEAVRAEPAVRACMVVTSDKCYEPATGRAHREGDPLGGAEPYSASKAGAELVVRAFASSIAVDGGARRQLGLATARAGNIIGGGDWAADRLLPDCMRALHAGEPIRLRRPRSIRPWQHVADAVSGYLTLGATLLREPHWRGGYNFGPHHAASAGTTVADVVRLVVREWAPSTPAALVEEPSALYEEATLSLDAGRAHRELQWWPRLDLADTVAWTVEWYRRAYAGDDVRELTSEQLGRWHRHEAAA